MEKKEFKTEVAGRPLTIEVSSLAEQTNAAVLVKYGDTVVLGTAVMSRKEKDLSYLPLRVDYEERFYAAGKIMGSRFMRREGRPSEDATLSGRLVDRVIRPLFDNRIRRDIQVVVTVLSYDEEQDPDFPGMIAASTALSISDIPWDGPAAGVRIAKIGEEYIIAPDNSKLDDDAVEFQAFVAGPKNKISMIELEGSDAEESNTIEAFSLAQKEIDALVAFQEGIVKEIGKEKTEVDVKDADPSLREKASAFLADRLEEAVYPHLHPKPDSHPLEKVERENRLSALFDDLIKHLDESVEEGSGDDAYNRDVVYALFEEIVDDLVHKNILENELRPDGRKLDEVRSLEGQVGLFERTHGSALFVRGNTQALAVTTLAPPGQEQLVESIETAGKRRFMLHYNFPSFSVGETGPFRSPGRREIGHGALASKAMAPVIPDAEVFPYTIRVVSEILSSNGSSSMATVCSATLSLMDAGVPIKKPVAGIAMGLIVGDGGSYKVLTDIQGPEDHYGDMDFKVAGTKDGVNAVQLDVKIGGLNPQMIKETLEQAKVAREEILGVMNGVISAPREKISKYAPLVLIHKIDPSKIGAVIGSGGKTINGLIERYELTSIDVEEDGTIFVSSTDSAKAEQALEEIKALTHEYELGEMVEGKVVRLMDFGAIVDLGGGRDGMIHVSELKDGYVKEASDVLKMGDFVKAKVIRVDADGKIGLSLKQAK